MNVLKKLFIVLILCLIMAGNAFSMKQWEKDVYLKTRDVKRIPAEIAYQMYLSGKSLLISVDDYGYYEQKRLVQGIHIPKRKFTETFIKKNLTKFKKYKYILLYCR